MSMPAEVPSWFTAYTASVKALNPYQKAVVAEIRGGPRKGETNPLVVLAYAGAGKTHTLATAVASLVANDQTGIRPEDIILTTFTKVGAEEMKKRLARIAPADKLAKVRIGTFHSLAYRRMAGILRGAAPAEILKAYPHRFDINSRCKDADRLIGRIVGEPWSRKEKGPTGWTEKVQEIEGLQGSTRGMSLVRGKFSDPNKKFPTDAKASDYSRAISSIINQGIGLNDPRAAAACARYSAPVGDPARVGGVDERDTVKPAQAYLPQLLQVWKYYALALSNLGQWTFDDVLFAYYKYGQDSAKLILVDEVQDNSPLQMLIAEEIAERGKGRRVLIGDISQSIYAFNGAAPDITEAVAIDPQTTTLYIPTNYRSGRRIVELGNEILREAPWEARAFGIPAKRHDFTGELPEGSVSTFGCSLLSETPDKVMTDIQNRMATEGLLPQHFAILSRSNLEGEALELAAYAAGIPSVRVGQSLSFFDRAIVADVLAYLTLTEHDDMAALGRVCNLDKRTPTGSRYLGEAKVRSALDASRPKSMAEALHMLSAQPGMNQRGIIALSEGIRELRTWKWSTLGGVSLLDKIWPLVSTVKVGEAAEDIEGESEDRVESEADGSAMEHAAYAVLRSVLTRFKTLNASLDHIAKLKGEIPRFGDEVDSNLAAAEALGEAQKERMTISTIHRAKGREFRIVYLMASSGKLPSYRAIKEGMIDEERRLFYVGVTRAEEDLVIVHSRIDDTKEKHTEMGASEFTVDFVHPYLAEQAGIQKALQVVDALATAEHSDVAAGLSEGALSWVDKQGIQHTLKRSGSASTGDRQWFPWSLNGGEALPLVAALEKLQALLSLNPTDPEPEAEVEPVEAEVEVQAEVQAESLPTVAEVEPTLEVQTEVAKVVEIPEVEGPRRVGWVRIEPPPALRVDTYNFSRIVAPWSVEEPRRAPWGRFPTPMGNLPFVGLSMEGAIYLLNGMTTDHQMVVVVYEVVAEEGELVAHVVTHQTGAIASYPQGFERVYQQAHTMAGRVWGRDPLGRWMKEQVLRLGGAPEGFLSEDPTGSDTNQPPAPASTLVRLRLLFEITNGAPFDFGKFMLFESPQSFYHPTHADLRGTHIGASLVTNEVVQGWRSLPYGFFRDAGATKTHFSWSEVFGGVDPAPVMPPKLKNVLRWAEPVPVAEDETSAPAKRRRARAEGPAV